MQFTTLLAILGLFNLISLLSYLLPQLIISILPKKNLAKRYGKSWALITGASQGCGKCYAHTLAKQGMNVILVARDKKALDQVADDIKQKNPGVETCVIVSDLSGDARTVSQHIFSLVKEYDISTLIINAGFAIPECAARPEPANLAVLQTNVVTQMHLFSLIYPKICRRQRAASGRVGGVIFMSSANADLPAPFTQWYSGTKSFLAQFARCLAEEADPFGVDVVSVLPGIIRTEFQGRLPPLKKCDDPQASDALSQSAQQVCDRVLSALGTFTECHSGAFPILAHLLMHLFDVNVLSLILSRGIRSKPSLKQVFDLSDDDEVDSSQHDPTENTGVNTESPSSEAEVPTSEDKKNE